MESLEMIINELSGCTMEYNKELKCVIQNWSGFSGSNNFRAAILATLNFFKENKDVSYIISDTRKHKVVIREDTNWVAEQINPQLIKHGLKKIAFIMPQIMTAKISVEKFSESSSKELQIGHFAEMDQAVNWIKEA